MVVSSVIRFGAIHKINRSNVREVFETDWDRIQMEGLDDAKAGSFPGSMTSGFHDRLVQLTGDETIGDPDYATSQGRTFLCLRNAETDDVYVVTNKVSPFVATATGYIHNQAQEGDLSAFLREHPLPLVSYTTQFIQGWLLDREWSNDLVKKQPAPGPVTSVLNPFSLEVSDPVLMTF